MFTLVLQRQTHTLHMAYELFDSFKNPHRCCGGFGDIQWEERLGEFR